MFTGGAPASMRSETHLQIREIWPTETSPNPPSAHHRRACGAGDRALAAGGSGKTGDAPDWPIGLQGLRPGRPYTRGVPSPRPDAREWDLAFRRKLVAAIAARRRRAYVSIGAAATGLVLLTAGFAVTIVATSPDTHVAGSADGLTHLANAASQASAPDDARASPEAAGETQGSRQPDQAVLSRQPADADIATSSRPMPIRQVAAYAQRATPVIVQGETIPAGAMILVRGLPAGLTLSAGMATTTRTWVLGLEQLRDVAVIAPADFAGTIDILVDVMGSHGLLLQRQAARLVLPAAHIVLTLVRPVHGHPARAHPPLGQSGPAAPPPPAARPGHAAPQLHARGAPAGTQRPPGASPLLDTAWRTSLADGTPQEPPTDDAPRPRRTLASPPAYGLGGPR